MLKALLQTQLYVLYVTFSTNNVSFFFHNNLCGLFQIYFKLGFNITCN